MTCVTAGGGPLWLGDADGFMHCMDASCTVSAFRAHERPVRHCLQTPSHPRHQLLITVAIDEANPDPDPDNEEERICVWNTKKWCLTSKTSLPVLCRSLYANPQPGRHAGRITCLAVSPSLDYLLLGHSSGLVQLIKCDLYSDK